jgi:hypothetical protein
MVAYCASVMRCRMESIFSFNRISVRRHAALQMWSEDGGRLFGFSWHHVVLMIWKMEILDTAHPLPIPHKISGIITKEEEQATI